MEGQGALGDVGLRGLLVRVRAVPEGDLLRALGQGGLLVGGGVRDGVGGDVLPAEVVGDGGVVRGGVGERLGLEVDEGREMVSNQLGRRSLESSLEVP